MSCGNDGAVPINCFALVTYIPDPLGEFLDHLRRDLVPNCVPRAHVTVLPPRQVSVPAGAAVEQLGAWMADMPAFEIEARDVEIFENTSVIHIGLGAGRAELERMHERLNSGPLAFAEPFSYHPHITLAQDLEPGQVLPLFEEAKRRWRDFKGPRRFAADTVTFVQNTDRNRWLDLARWSLNELRPVR
jgi:2'-5' RNA ligase